MKNCLSYIFIINFINFTSLPSFSASYSTMSRVEEEDRGYHRDVINHIYVATTVTEEIIERSLDALTTQFPEESQRDISNASPENTVSPDEEELFATIEDRMAFNGRLLAFMKDTGFTAENRLHIFYKSIEAEPLNKDLCRCDLEVLLENAQLAIEGDIKLYDYLTTLLLEGKLDLFCLFTWRRLLVEKRGVQRNNLSVNNENLEYKFLVKLSELVRNSVHPEIIKWVEENTSTAYQGVEEACKTAFTAAQEMAYRDPSQANYHGFMRETLLNRKFLELYQSYYVSQMKSLPQIDLGQFSNEKNTPLIRRIVELREQLDKLVEIKNKAYPRFLRSFSIERHRTSCKNNEFINQPYENLVEIFISLYHQLFQLREAYNELETIETHHKNDKAEAKKKRNAAKRNKRKNRRDASTPAAAAPTPAAGTDIVETLSPDEEDSFSFANPQALTSKFAPVAVAAAEPEAAGVSLPKNVGPSTLPIARKPNRIPARVRWQQAAENMRVFLAEKTRGISRDRYVLNEALEDARDRGAIDQFINNPALKYKKVRSMLQKLGGRLTTEGVETTVIFRNPPRGFECHGTFHAPHSDGEAPDHFTRFLILETLKRAGYLV